MTMVWHRYYKEKVTFENIAHVPTFQNAYKAYKVILIFL